MKGIFAVIGLVLIALGGLFLLAGLLPSSFRLPGDIVIRRGNFTFYFPLTTCIIASALLTLIVALLMRWRWPF